MKSFSGVMAALLASFATLNAADPVPVHREIPAGETQGQVVKISSNSITIKVSQRVQSGTPRHTVRGPNGSRRTVSTPKYTTKQVDTTFLLTDNVKVRAPGNKQAGVTDIKAGETVHLYLADVQSGVTGKKLETHREVNRIDIAHAAAAPSTSK